MLLASMLALMSCGSTPAAEQKTVELYTQFPNPYDENGNQIVTFEDGYVKMPLWYWLKICDYVIDTEANKELRE